MPNGMPEVSDDPIVRFWEWMESEAQTDEDISGLAGLVNHLDTFWQRRDEPNVAVGKCVGDKELMARGDTAYSAISSVFSRVLVPAAGSSSSNT